ncbi:MAG: phage holin family protein [Burkholderiales bacterium]|nr:phage holin family protein [Burkholderiales bacterium]
MPEAANGTGSRAGGVLDSLKAAARNLVALGRTRLELLANELQEQREFLLRELVLALLALFCLGMGLACIAGFLVLLSWYLWQDLRATLVVAGAVAALFLVAALVLSGLARSTERRRPRAFAATLAELSKDRDSLQ